MSNIYLDNIPDDPLAAIDKAVTEVDEGCDVDWRINPVTFEEFVASQEHMDHPPLSPRQLNAVYSHLGKDPKKIFAGRSRYTISVLLYGKGSGKDLMASLVHCYLTYVLLCMRNPQKYFDWPETEHIDVLNVACSSGQAAGG